MIFKTRQFTWSFTKKNTPRIMGVLNVTPDSFSDGARYITPQAAFQHACDMVAEGADMIDIGAESTRPGSQPISAKEEKARLLPVLKKIVKTLHVPVSVDTTKADVADACLACGAAIINDISGLSADKRMGEVVRRAQAGIIVMHMRGTPATMHSCACYDHVVKDVIRELKECLKRVRRAGIPASSCMIDPGIGFAKTAEQNIQVIHDLRALSVLKRPIVLGPSRKSFIGHVLTRDVNEREWGTLAAVAYGRTQGVQVVRVHNVKAVRDFLTMMQVLEKGRTNE